MSRKSLSNTGMKFPIKLKTLIEARGWNKSQVAKWMRVSPTTLTRWTKEEEEEGKRKATKPKLDQILALSRLFAVPMEYLADDAMDAPPPGLTWEERAILEFSRGMGLQAAMQKLARPEAEPAPGLAFTPTQGFLGPDGRPATPPAPPGRGAGKPPR